MRMRNIGFAVALMLGGMATAFAQGGPNEEKGMQGPPQSRESGPPASTDGSKGGGASVQNEGKRAQQAEPKGEKSKQGGQKAEKSTGDEGSKGRQAREGNAQDKGQKSTTQSKDSAANKQAEPKEESKKTAEPKSAEPSNKAQSKDSETAKTEAGAHKDADKAKQVQVTGEKGDKVRSAFRSSSDVKQEKVDVNISVGTRLPRSLHFRPVPVAVIELVPEYRDFVFVYVDDRYVICEPDTYEVVAIVDASGGSATLARGGGGDGKCSTNVTLTDDEQALILKSIQISQGEDVTGIAIGSKVPQSVELRSFPDPVLSRTAKLNSCRYFIAEDKIAIVNPDDEKIVLLIDKD